VVPPFSVDIPDAPVAPGDSAAILIHFQPIAVQSYTEEVVIESNDRDSPVYFLVRGTGDFWYLTPQPSVLNFGSIQLGDSATEQISFLNSSSTSLTIDAYVAPVLFYSELTVPRRLEPGESVTTTVMFRPDSSGLFWDSLEVDYHGLDGPLKIRLIGIAGIEDADERVLEIPAEFSLGANYPNPFNPATSIPFALPVTGHVELNIYDITGREIATLLDETLTAGNHTVTFDGAGHPSGIYIAHLTSGSFSASRKMILLK
jgi:hypothetical protein